MSALLAPHAGLEVLSGQDRSGALDPVEQCRFCHCSEEAPCEVAVCEDGGVFRLARTLEETSYILACAWFLPGICSAPACMEKLQRELRGEAGPVILFDAYGSRAG